MSVFVIVQGNPDPAGAEALQHYQQNAGAVIQKYGAQIVVRGQGLGSLHGPRHFQVGLVLRFPDRAAVEAWLSDPDYQRLIPFRNKGYAELELTLYQE